MVVKFNKKISDISEYFQEQGFFYSYEQIYNFYVSLKTKPFVILSGISGSGKSKIADLFSEYMSKAYQIENNYEVVAVKPNWIDNRGLFGYRNLLNETYEITPVLKIFMRALNSPEKPFFLVLDEMNLAKVEYYFSDFLSLIESRRIEKDGSGESKFTSVLEHLGNKITLSEAIILAAIQLDTDDFMGISDYRSAPICQWWLKRISATENDTAQFRSELNQGRPGGEPQENGYRPDGTRLAGKAFWGEEKGNSYKLKKLDEMDVATKAKVKRLYDAYNNCNNSIKQEKISLHNKQTPIKTFENQNEYSGNLFDGSEYFVPNEIEIPLNLFVIGTVNIDETTYMFSPKVLDRSNVIEYNEIDLFGAYDFGNPEILNDTGLRSVISEKICDLEISIPNSNVTRELIYKHPNTFSVINEIFETLRVDNKHFGYRVFNEISQFIINYIGDSTDQLLLKKAIDLQFLQKILPKINGTDNEILLLMNNLKEIAETNGLEKSLTKINRMINQLNTEGYTTFIE